MAYSKTIIFSSEHLLFTYFKCEIQNRSGESIQDLVFFEFWKGRVNGYLRQKKKKPQTKKNRVRVNSVPAEQIKVKLICSRET